MVRLDDALAWRLRRHALDPPTATSVSDVADRVVAMRAWPSEAAALTIATRLSVPRISALDASLGSGTVIRSYAFRGGSYVFTPGVAADLLTVRTATRIWETARWQRQGGFEIGDWTPLREAVRGMLAAGPLTRDEISASLQRIPALKHLAHAAGGAGADSLYKPLHWWGDICFGPSKDGVSTFQLLGAAGTAFTSPDIDEAGRRCVRAYVHAYAPVTRTNLHYWLTDGLGVPNRRVHKWLVQLASDIVAVVVDGEEALVLAADLDDLHATHPADGVNLLPAFDPWVFGPGTADPRITPPQHRALASNGSNIVLFSGRVAGTWFLRKGTVTIRTFSQERLPADRLDHEVQRLSAMWGKSLEANVEHAALWMHGSGHSGGMR